MNPGDLYWRQMDILSPQLMEHQRVTLIGCGGIGSPVALVLAKMGLKSFTLYDPDTIEVHNLPNQMYPKNTMTGIGDVIDYVPTIGMKKADILANLVYEFGSEDGSNTLILDEPYTDQPLSGIVISGVDNMPARHTIWQGVKANREGIDLYIDARMGAQVGLVYSIDPNDSDQVDFFESVALYTDAEAIEQPCTNRAIIYNTFMIAALVGRQVRNHLRDLHVPKEIICDMETLALITEGGIL